MFEPMYTPWGNIQTCKILTPGVFEVNNCKSRRNYGKQRLYKRNSFKRSAEMRLYGGSVSLL